MELRVLRYFLAVARTGTLTAAAAQLNVTQPALSRQLKLLETELGVQLINREHKPVTLTMKAST
ncbi:MAG TPA: LysR family transcriptional regulator [Weissella cibaria]|nr:LysR family transcriptional regulator [Weissella cibaria]